VLPATVTVLVYVASLMMVHAIVLPGTVVVLVDVGVLVTVLVVVLLGTVAVLVDVSVDSTVDVGIDRHEQADEIKLSAKIFSAAGTVGIGGVDRSSRATARFCTGDPSVLVETVVAVTTETSSCTS
jgi:hypothetical protein